MAGLEPVKCPNCGAQITIDRMSEVVACAYCHVSSLVKRDAGTTSPAEVPVIVLDGPSAISGVALLVAGALLVLVGGTVAVLMFRSSPSVATLPATPPGPSPARMPEEPPSEAGVPSPPQLAAKPAADYRVERRPLVGDADGDGNDDVIVLVNKTKEGQATQHYAAFKGKGGARLSETPALTRGFASSAAVAPGRLVVETKQGQLSGYDLKSGDLQWTTVLGDRVVGYCAGPGNESIEVISADGRRITVDTKTGRQTAVSGAPVCQALRSDQEELWRNPRDRSDARAPLGVASMHCGSVRVMGSELLTIRVDLD